MSEFICFLITFARLTEYNRETGEASRLVKTAVSIHRDKLPHDVGDYTREYQREILAHVPTYAIHGDVVDIELIAAVADHQPKAAVYVDYVTDHVSDFTTITAKKSGSDDVLVINDDHPLYQQLLDLQKELP